MVFEKREEAWIEPLAFDPAYLNAMIFTTLDYFDSMQHRSRDDVTQRTLPHYLRTVRLLRERIMHEDNQSLTTPTVAAILALAAHAHFVGDTESAKHHLEGLRKIVGMRGGVATFTGNAKLLVEILRYEFPNSLSQSNMVQLLIAMQVRHRDGAGEWLKTLILQPVVFSRAFPPLS